MQVNISARHIALTPAIADYVEKKVGRCERFFDHLVWAHVILSVEKYRQVAEVVIHAKKTTFRAKEESTDLYAAIDLTIDKMEKQLKKHKEISKVHRKSKTTLLKTPADKREKILSLTETETSKYLLSEVKRFDIKPVSVPEAIDEMELLGYQFFMFLNAETSQINVIYKRENGSYGLLEPQL